MAAELPFRVSTAQSQIVAVEGNWCLNLALTIQIPIADLVELLLKFNQQHGPHGQQWGRGPGAGDPPGPGMSPDMQYPPGNMHYPPRGPSPAGPPPLAHMPAQQQRAKGKPAPQRPPGPESAATMSPPPKSLPNSPQLAGPPTAQAQPTPPTQHQPPPQPGPGQAAPHGGPGGAGPGPPAGRPGAAEERNWDLPISQIATSTSTSGGPRDRFRWNADQAVYFLDRDTTAPGADQGQQDGGPPQAKAGPTGTDAKAKAADNGATGPDTAYPGRPAFPSTPPPSSMSTTGMMRPPSQPPPAAPAQGQGPAPGNGAQQGFGGTAPGTSQPPFNAGGNPGNQECKTQ